MRKKTESYQDSQFETHAVKPFNMNEIKNNTLNQRQVENFLNIYLLL